MSEIERQILLFYHLYVELKKKIIAHIKTKTGSHTQKTNKCLPMRGGKKGVQ